MNTNQQTTLTKQELASYKLNLFQMIKDSGKMDQPYYESVAESLDGLNFKEFTPDQFRHQLLLVIEEMMDLADVAFDINHLSTIQHKLR
jgi:hypothetical protein